MEDIQKIKDNIEELYTLLKSKFEIKEEDNTLVYISNILRIQYKKDKDILDLSFNISVDPVVSSRISLYFSELDLFNRINSCCSYFIQDNKILNGDEALDAYLNDLRKTFRNEFENEKYIRNILETVEPLGSA